MSLDYYICANCGCLTETDRRYCNGCNKELPHRYWEALGEKPLKVSFRDTTERDHWLKLCKQYGFMKVWKQ